MFWLRVGLTLVRLGLIDVTAVALCKELDPVVVPIPCLEDQWIQRWEFVLHRFNWGPFREELQTVYVAVLVPAGQVKSTCVVKVGALSIW